MDPVRKRMGIIRDDIFPQHPVADIQDINCLTRYTGPVSQAVKRTGILTPFQLCSRFLAGILILFLFIGTLQQPVNQVLLILYGSCYIPLFVQDLDPVDHVFDTAAVLDFQQVPFPGDHCHHLTAFLRYGHCSAICINIVAVAIRFGDHLVNGFFPGADHGFLPRQRRKFSDRNVKIPTYALQNRICRPFVHFCHLVPPQIPQDITGIYLHRYSGHTSLDLRYDPKKPLGLAVII